MTRPIVIACAAFGLSVLCYGQAKETDERDVRIETVEPGSVRVMVKHAQDAAREYEKSVMLRTLGDDTGKRLDVE
ncbi:MAG: hypothetical protein FJX72_14205, partial [Armatimonadetes bacterium]|nr:hypothetical protein [Armatimonadota bacterium]